MKKKVIEEMDERLQAALNYYAGEYERNRRQGMEFIYGDKIEGEIERFEREGGRKYNAKEIDRIVRGLGIKGWKRRCFNLYIEEGGREESDNYTFKKRVMRWIDFRSMYGGQWNS